MKDYTSPQMGKEIRKMLNNPQSQRNIKRVWNKFKTRLKFYMNKNEFEKCNSKYSK